MMGLCPMWIPYCVYWFIKKGEESMNSNMRKMYTEKEIAELVNEEVLKGNVSIGGNLLVAGDVQVKTISQSQPNWEMEATPTLSASAITKGFTLTPIYNKVCLFGNVLYVVMINKLNNPTESSLGVDYNDTINLELPNIPSSIGSKIFDVNGKDLTEESTDTIDINRSISGIVPSQGYINYKMVLNHQGSNKMFVSLLREDAYNIPSGSLSIITGRDFLIIE